VTNKYQPEYPSLDVEYLYREFQRIATALEGVSRWDVSYGEPEKPRAGDIRYADGTEWDPGSGEGLYRYNLAGNWIFIG